MKFPHLTQQALTLDGFWQDNTPHLRFTGTLSSSAPFVILSLLKYGVTYHYMKHAKSVIHLRRDTHMPQRFQTPEALTAHVGHFAWR